MHGSELSRMASSMDATIVSDQREGTTVSFTGGLYTVMSSFNVPASAVGVCGVAASGTLLVHLINSPAGQFSKIPVNAGADTYRAFDVIKQDASNIAAANYSILF